MAESILAPESGKACRRCGIFQPLTGYAKAPSCLDGHRATCRQCLSAANAAKAKRYRERHPERAKEIAARYLAAHPEKRAETRAKNYGKNADYYKEKSRLRYYADKEAAALVNKAWRKKNAEQVRARQAAYKQANKGKVREMYAKWEAANKEARLTINRNRRARQRGAAGKLSRDIKQRLFVLQKGLCACCRQPLGEKYHLDHIVPLALGGSNEDSNMQLLRAFCNLSKKDKHPIDYMQQKGFLL